jgi:hypothetical protein
LHFILDKEIKIVDIVHGMHYLIVIYIMEEAAGLQAMAQK